MGTTGGEALAIGIWYQTVGAVAHLVSRGEFHGEALPGGPANGEYDGVFQGEERRLLLEPYDMDAAIRDEEGLTFIQFKATTQPGLPSFTPTDVRNIFCNAAQAFLEHERKGSDPIVQFVLVTNRREGPHFEALRTIAAGLKMDRDEAEFQAAFAEAPAPRKLFQAYDEEGPGTLNSLEPSRRRSKGVAGNDGTMRALASKLVRGMVGSPGVTPEQRAEACLKAMGSYRFVQARCDEFIRRVKQWLATWGVLPGAEEESCLHAIIGYIADPSRRTWTCESIMHAVLASPSALPLTPRDFGPVMVRELKCEFPSELPTPNQIQDSDASRWMLDRTALLQGLPSFRMDAKVVGIEPDRRCSTDPQANPRIFALVGPGGAGKTSLMARLFKDLADRAQDPSQFLGYPLMLVPVGTALRELDSKIAGFAGRRGTFDVAEKRLAVACEIKDKEPALWLGLDGLDEIKEDDLRNVARSIASIAGSRPHLRFVLTCRDSQFEKVRWDLNHGGLLHKLPVGNFDPEREVPEAVAHATDGKLRGWASEEAAVGDDPSEAVSGDEWVNEFKKSLRQPLFIGVIQRLCSQERVELVQRAYDGDEEARRRVAEAYFHVFCERLAKRMGNDPGRVFRALQQLARNLKNSREATEADWEEACRKQFPEKGIWSQLFRQCDASGLIRELRSALPAFEWEHPLVARYLPSMGENPEWK